MSKKKVVVKKVDGFTLTLENVIIIDKTDDLKLVLENGNEFKLPFTDIERVSISDMISESNQSINGWGINMKKRIEEKAAQIQLEYINEIKTTGRSDYDQFMLRKVAAMCVVIEEQAKTIKQLTESLNIIVENA